MNYAWIFQILISNCMNNRASLYILYSLQSLAYVNHSWLVGRSNKFPRNGNFVGPGGSGKVERFLILTWMNAMRTRVARMARQSDLSIVGFGTLWMLYVRLKQRWIRRVIQYLRAVQIHILSMSMWLSWDIMHQQLRCQACQDLP